MILSNQDFKVVYVDPSVSASGTGNAPDDALSALPVTAAEIEDGTAFIIRRTSENYIVNLPQGGNPSLQSLAFIGMPKPGDEFYGLMPQEARTAWGEDLADYANVRARTTDTPYSGESLGLSLDSCSTFFLQRVYLFREGQDAYECAIRLPNANGTSAVSLERCRFGTKGMDLDRDGYVSVPSNGAGMFLECGKPQVLSVRHCVFNANPSCEGGPECAAWVVRARGASSLCVFDVEVWCATVQYGGDGGMPGGGPLLDFGTYDTYNGSVTCDCCNVEGVRFHYLRNGTFGYLPQLLSIYGKNFTCLRRLDISMAERRLGEGTPSVVSPCGILIQCMNAGEFIFEQLTACLPEVWRIFHGGNVFRLSGSSVSSRPGCAKKVQDISVTLGTEGGIDTEGKGDYYDDCKAADTSQWGDFAAVRLEFNSSNRGWEPVIVRNVQVIHPHGVALYVSHCYLQDTTLQGVLRAVSSTCDVGSLLTWYPGNAVGATGGSTVRIGTLNLGKGNVAGADGDPAILGNPQGSSSFIYVETCNGPLMSDTRNTVTNIDNCYAVVCANEQDKGHYTMRTANAMCNTWGVARSGGAVAASLKLFNNTADGLGCMSLGQQPFGGFRIAAEPGLRMLTLHVATKGLSEMDELARRVIAQVAVPQADGTCDMLFSCACGRWVPDGSQWIGESGLKAFRLEIPLNVPVACDVDVKIHFKWYSPSGYLYLDPGMSIA